MKLSKTDTTILLSSNVLYLYIIISLIIIITVPNNEDEVVAMAPGLLIVLGALALYKGVVWTKIRNKYHDLSHALYSRGHEVTALTFLERHYLYQMATLFVAGPGCIIAGTVLALSRNS